MNRRLFLKNTSVAGLCVSPLAALSTNIPLNEIDKDSKIINQSFKTIELKKH